MSWQILKAHCETGHFSHGYLLIGDYEHFRPWVRKAASVILECEESSVDSHPDFSEQFFDLFSFNESRDLLSKAAMKPILSAKRVFSLGIASMAAEAASSLLKILEEPPPTCHFFFLTHSVGDMPSALQSRLLSVSEEGNFELASDKRKFYDEFLKAGPVERLNLVKNISSEKKLALDFLNELEVILSEHLLKENRTSETFKNLILFLEEIKAKRRFLFDRAPAPKMIIEHFALVLPRLK